MINTFIQPLQTTLASISFADRVAGIVLTAQKDRMKGKVKVGTDRFPISQNVLNLECEQVSTDFTDLLPNSKYNSVIYFEQLGDSTLTDIRENDNFVYQSDVRLICWVNLKKVGYKDYPTTDRVIQTLLQSIYAAGDRITNYSRNAVRFPIIDPSYTGAVVEYEYLSVAQRDLDLFRRYTTAKEYLNQFDYFALNFRMYMEVGLDCVDPVVEAEIC